MNDDARDAAHKRLLPGLDLAVFVKAKFDAGQNIDALKVIRTELDVSLVVALEWYKSLTGFTVGRHSARFVESAKFNAETTPRTSTAGYGAIFDKGFTAGAKWQREKIEETPAKPEPPANVVDDILSELQKRVSQMTTFDLTETLRAISKVCERAATN